MPTEPERKPVAKRVPRARYRDDGFVVQEAGGFEQLTPEQRTWRVEPLFPDVDRSHSTEPPEGVAMDPVPLKQQPEWLRNMRRPKPRPDEPPTAPGTPPSPPG